MGINTSAWGMLNYDNLSRMDETLKRALNEYPRLMALDILLRYPLKCDYSCNESSSVMTVFIRSLKAQINADLKRKRKSGKRTYPCNIRYFWCREFREDENTKHYHVILLFNRDAYAYPGFYAVVNKVVYRNNLARMIMEAWMRALGLSDKPDYEKYYPVVEFPKDCYYHLSVNSPKYQEEYDALLPRMKYMAKEYSRVKDDGERNFGCSQK